MVAGVRLSGGRLVWVDTRTVSVHVGEMAVIRVGESEERGLVCVGPHQLVAGTPTSQGIVIAVCPVEDDESNATCEMPLAAIPPLGTHVDTPRGSARVTSLDPVAGKVGVTLDDGSMVTYDASEVTEEGA
jgi:hypothetical protein